MGEGKRAARYRAQGRVVPVVRFGLLFVPLFGTLTSTPPAVAAITYTDLYTLGTPAGASYINVATHDAPTQAFADGQSVGYGSNVHALLWAPTSPGGVDLNPTGFSNSQAVATDGTYQVGSGQPSFGDTRNHALRWSGTAASAVQLLPPTGFLEASAAGVDSLGNVVGAGKAPVNRDHALFWPVGTPAVAVDLNPAGFDSSNAKATCIPTPTTSAQQVGSGRPLGSSHTHALLWFGTATSAIDLNPAGFDNSFAFGTNGTQQVGEGNPTLAGTHALVWTGLAASAVDLTPGFENAAAMDTDGTYQVGFGNDNIVTHGYTHAMVWSGTAASMIDLNSVLPPTVFESEATTIDGDTIYGYAVFGNTIHAIAWTVPEPTGLGAAGCAAMGLLSCRRRKR